MKFFRNLGCKLRAATHAFKRASGCPKCGGQWDFKMGGFYCTKCPWIDDVTAKARIQKELASELTELALNRMESSRWTQ